MITVDPEGMKENHPRLTRTRSFQIFSDKSITIEDIMAQRGEAVKLGGIDADGDVELWNDPREQNASARPTETEKKP